jgi:hypothetical protein
MDQTKFDILKTELLLTQQQMDKYDQLSTSIKAWVVTLWVAASGWAFYSNRREMLFAAPVLVIIFWYFDGLNKTFRTNYKNRRDEVSLVMEMVFKGEAIPAGFSAPRLPVQDFKGVAKSMFQSHMIAPYIFLMVVPIVLYFIF